MNQLSDITINACFFYLEQIIKEKREELPEKGLQPILQCK